mgnify:CR=1 FL=1
MNRSTSIYQDIAARTGGSIYIGVVGPVRTGKSTFIKQFMEQLVLPAMSCRISTIHTAVTGRRMSCRRAAPAAPS